MVSGIDGLGWRDVLELGTEAGSTSFIVVSRGVCSPPAEVGGTVASRCESLVVPSVAGPPLFGGDSLCPRLGDENGFLLTTPPGAASRGVVGDSGTRFNRVEVGEFCADREFCRPNSQSSGRMTKIRVVESMTSGPWMSSRLRSPRIRPLHTIQEPLGKGFVACRIQPSRELHGCCSMGKRRRTWHMCTPLWGGRSLSGSR